MVLETLRCLTQVTQYFSKTAGEALLVPLGRAAALFHAMAPAYRAGFVEAAEGGEETVLDSDGETLSLETVTSQIVELIMTLVEHPRLSATLANALDDTVYQAIGPHVHDRGAGGGLARRPQPVRRRRGRRRVNRSAPCAGCS